MDELINLKSSTSIYGDESEYTRIAAIDLIKKEGGQIAIEFDNSAQHRVKANKGTKSVIGLVDYG